MTDKVSVEVVRRVYDDSEGAFIEVGPGQDGFGVEIRTTEKASREYFGEVQLCLSAALAAQVGAALIAASKEGEPA